VSTQRVQQKASAPSPRAADRPAKRALRDGRPAKPVLPEKAADERAAPPPLPVSEILRIVAVCACIVVAAVASALAVDGRGATVYGARADVLYVADPATPLDVRDRTLATQRELIQSRAVLAPVAARDRMPLEDLQDAVSVEAGARNDLLHITVGDEQPARARQLTEAVTAGYLALAGRLAGGGAQERRRLERQIERLTGRARRASAAESALLGQRVADLQDRVVQLDSGGAAPARPTLLSDAYPLADPLAPKPLRAVATGLIAGLALAAGAAVLLARRNRRWPGH
jgi:capsular polysaccharide biosynthesis protein